MALSFSCRDAGASCSGHVQADTKEELLEKIANHFQGKHRVKTMTQTIVNYALTAVKEK